jgi:type IV pilus assembly protein PilA
MQLKEKPELNQINQESEALVKTYQPDRPIKERKSVAKTDRTNLQPIKERKSVARVDRTNLQPIKEPKSVARVDRQNLQPLKEPKAVARVDREHLRPIKNRKSVATTEWPDLPPLKERKFVATTYQPYLRPIKERESVATTLLKIIFIYFPLGILKILFSKFSVVAIIMILLPLSCSELGRCRPYKAMQSEAKQYAGSINRAQQAKYAEDGAFSNSLTDLGLGIKTQTTNYNYSIGATKNAAFSYAVSRSNNLRSYVGAVFLVPVSSADNNTKTTVSILCEATSFGKIQLPNPIVQNNVPVCAAGSSEVSK